MNDNKTMVERITEARVRLQGQPGRDPLSHVKLAALERDLRALSRTAPPPQALPPLAGDKLP